MNIGLRSCAETGTLTCIRLALALGADPQSKTGERTTDEMGSLESAVRHAPFRFADSCTCTCLRLVTLLGAGADPNEDFVFPWVAESWNQTCTTAMLSFGADPGKIHSTGESALLAVFSNPASFENCAGIVPMIKLLLRVKPNPQRAGRHRPHPAYVGCYIPPARSRDRVSRCRRRSTIRDKKGKTALDHAFGDEIRGQLKRAQEQWAHRHLNE